MNGTGEGGEARPSTTQVGVPAPSKICLPGMDLCLKFLDDPIPLEVKKKVLERPVGKDLQWFIRIAMSVSLLSKDFNYRLPFKDIGPS